jgi:TetR/AcrR family fatty acid metabolism transcriptional regulator
MSQKMKIETNRQMQIIEAALRLIARHGSHNVSIQSVATEAGLSKGAVLHYFPTKEELFAAVFKEFFRQIFERIKNTMDLHDDPIEKLRSIGDWLFDENDPTVRLGYPIYLECMARAVYEKMFNRLFREWVSNWVSLIIEAIQDGVRRGDFKSDIQPEATARAISAFCQGVASRWYLDRDQHLTEWARDTLISYTEGLLKKKE